MREYHEEEYRGGMLWWKIKWKKNLIDKKQWERKERSNID
jgi:hypothetical protein